MISRIVYCKLAIILCLLSAVCFGQRKTQLDSLVEVLRRAGNEPTEEVITLRNKIGKLYKQRNLKQALTFAEETLALAASINTPGLLTNSYALAADLANLTGDFKKGAYYANKTATSMTGLSDSLSQAKKYIV